MLEVMAPASLGERLGLVIDDSVPSVPGIARAARAAVAAWRSPPRQRVTTYLTRQLIAVGIDDNLARNCVRNTLDSLLDIGDFASIRLDGKACLVLARASAVRIADNRHALLGDQQGGPIDDEGVGIARHVHEAAGDERALSFSEWLGPPDFIEHAVRRSGSVENLEEYWTLLSSSLRHEGQPIGSDSVRILSLPPGTGNGFFGQVSAPTVAGRWTTTASDGLWCAARPGRNEQHWHPIALHVDGSKLRSLDLYDWDEWSWALLARGRALALPERQNWDDGLLAFEHQVPAQFVRALKLLGREGPRKWTWSLDALAFACFKNWQRDLV